MNKAARLWRGWAVAMAVLTGAGIIAPLSGQGPTTGVIRGVVREDGGALGQALITVTERESGVRRSAFTDASGDFEIGHLESGEYDLRVERLGFPPQSVLGVAVRPGRSSHITVRLSEQTAQGSASGTVLRGGLPGSSQWVPAFALQQVPAARGELDEALRLSTWLDDQLGAEGLPSWLSTYAIDGVPFRAARHPSFSAEAGAPLLRLEGLASAEVVANPVDVEWSPSAGAILSAHTRRGTATGTVRGAASWSSSALSSPGAFDAGSLDYQNINGSLLLRGAAFSDSARYVVGAAARKWETPISAAWPVNDVTAQLAAFGDSRDLNLAGYRSASLVPMDAVAGFATLDWSVAERHRFGLSINAASAPLKLALPAGGGTLESGRRDVAARATLRSQRESGARNTLNLSVSSSHRETSATNALRSTLLVPLDVSFGVGQVGSSDETSVRLADALEFRRGSSEFKLGADIMLTSHDYDHRRNSAGTYLFGGVAQLESGEGVFVRNTGGSAAATWSDTRFGVFAQNRWRSNTGIELTLGARVDRESALPTPGLDRNWAELTGIANDSVGAAAWRVSPRISLAWDVERQQRWLLHFAGGLYHDRVDPLLVADWKLHDGTAETLRAIGDLGAQWPTGEPAPTARARRLTLLGPEFRGPRSARVSGGVTHRLGGGTSMQLDALYRETRFLPRASDVNRIQSPGWQDGAGRGVYGALLQQGGLLVSDPGTSRRFPDYDQVLAYNADGWSRYLGATIGLQHALENRVSVLARYTFSRTTDNWFGARGSDGWGSPVPGALGDDSSWDEGTSDFDVPHRAAIGASVQTPIGVRLGALYRWQSGRAFTAGYRAAVDANGDGTPGNDPAFINTAVTGTDGLLGTWSCLRERSGGLAERNGCRGQATQTLDLQAALRVVRFGKGELSVNVEAIDLLETDFSASDAALYLVDLNGAVQRNEAARTITLPLVINPEFGEPLSRARPGRLLRLGAAFTF